MGALDVGVGKLVMTPSLVSCDDASFVKPAGGALLFQPKECIGAIKLVGLLGECPPAGARISVKWCCALGTLEVGVGKLEVTTSLVVTAVNQDPLEGNSSSNQEIA